MKNKDKHLFGNRLLRSRYLFLIVLSKQDAHSSVLDSYIAAVKVLNNVQNDVCAIDPDERGLKSTKLVAFYFPYPIAALGEVRLKAKQFFHERSRLWESLCGDRFA